MFGIAAHLCLFAFSPDLFWLVLASAFGCGSFCFLWSLIFVSITELIHWFKKCCPSRRHRRVVAMLGRMIALHHRMTQNASEMMQLIQETLNQADEAHSRWHHDGQGSLRQQYVRGRSLAESSRPRALDRAGVDEVNPPGPVMLHSVISETPTEPPPHVGFQSLQLHADHRHNPAVNPKSLSYGIITGDTNDSMDPRSKSPMVHDYVGQPGVKKANIPRSIMDKKGTDRRRTKRKRCRATSSEPTNSPEPPAHPAPRTPAPAPVSPCAGLFSSPESLPEPPAHAHSDAGNPGTPPEVPRAWTEEDDQQLCSLKGDSRSKYSYKSLAKKLNRSIADVTQRWKSLERLRKVKEQHQKAT